MEKSDRSWQCRSDNALGKADNRVRSTIRGFELDRAWPRGNENRLQGPPRTHQSGKILGELPGRTWVGRLRG